MTATLSNYYYACGLRHLEVNDKADVRFVKTHAERYCCHQNFDAVLEQQNFQLFPVLVSIHSEIARRWNNSCVVSLGVDVLFQRQRHSNSKNWCTGCTDSL